MNAMSTTSEMLQNENDRDELTPVVNDQDRAQNKKGLTGLVILLSLGAVISYTALHFSARASRDAVAVQTQQPKTDIEITRAESYLDGTGVAQNVVTGIDLLTKAADKGNADAAYRLGMLYEKGLGDNAISQAILGGPAEHNPTTELMQDYKKSATWYLQAAEQGDAAAQSALGRMYFSGNGVKADAKIAYKLETLAVSLGLKEAAVLQNQMIGQISSDQLPAVQQSIDAWGPVIGHSAQIVNSILHP
jgi:hypothetical protein